MTIPAEQTFSFSPMPLYNYGLNLLENVKAKLLMTFAALLDIHDDCCGYLLNDPMAVLRSCFFIITLVIRGFGSLRSILCEQSIKPTIC